MSTLLLPAPIQLKHGCVTCDSILEYLKHHVQQAHTGSDNAKDTPSPSLPEIQPLKEKSLNVNEASEKKSSAENVTVSKRRQKCNICPRKFRSKASLRHHKMFFHKRNGPLPDAPVNSDVVTRSKKEPDFQCDICDRKFRSHSYLRHHRMFFHKRDAPEPNKARKKAVRNKQESHVKCDVCDRKFTLQSNLSRHKRKSEIRGRSCLEDPSMTCIICNEVFVDRKKYLDHNKNSHRAGNRYQCPKCDETFADKRSVKIHMQETHNPNQNSPEKESQMDESRRWAKDISISYKEFIKAEQHHKDESNEEDSSDDIIILEDINIKDELMASATL